MAPEECCDSVCGDTGQVIPAGVVCYLPVSQMSGRCQTVYGSVKLRTPKIELKRSPLHLANLDVLNDAPGCSLFSI